jgi:hypothetical protein
MYVLVVFVRIVVKPEKEAHKCISCGSIDITSLETIRLWYGFFYLSSKMTILSRLKYPKIY